LSNEDRISVSIISKIEVLGFHKLTDLEKENLHLFFEAISTIRLNDEIVDEAIKLRQSKKMSLGDAIIAATALHKNIALLTNNITDFKHIEDLELIALDDIIDRKEERSFPME
jgi:predicted nucleic acid-binding protein